MRSRSRLTVEVLGGRVLPAPLVTSPVTEHVSPGAYSRTLTTYASNGGSPYTASIVSQTSAGAGQPLSITGLLLSSPNVTQDVTVQIRYTDVTTGDFTDGVLAIDVDMPAVNPPPVQQPNPPSPAAGTPGFGTPSSLLRFDGFSVDENGGGDGKFLLYNDDGSRVAVQPFESSYTGDIRVAKLSARNGESYLLVFPGMGGGPVVVVYGGKLAGGQLVEATRFFVYEASFRQGARIATSDLDGDGIDEIVSAPQRGGGPRIRVFGPEGDERANFFAFDPSFREGAYVATSDIDRDGRIDLVVEAPGQGQKVFLNFDIPGLIRRSAPPPTGNTIDPATGIPVVVGPVVTVDPVTGLPVV